MKRITKQIKRLKDFSLWGNGWTNNIVNDCERNLKNHVNKKVILFVCFLATCTHH